MNRCLFGLLSAGPSVVSQVLVRELAASPAALLAALPAFERTTGITVTTSRGSSQGTGANRISTQLERGATADVVVMSRDGLDELVAAGRVAPGSVIDLARSPLGVGAGGSPEAGYPDRRCVQEGTRRREVSDLPEHQRHLSLSDDDAAAEARHC